MEPATNRCTPAPLALAAVATAAAVFALALTEEYAPAGSPYAILVFAVLAWAHLPLLNPGRAMGFTLPRIPLSFAVPAGIAAIVLFAGVLLWKGQEQAHTTGVSPFGSAQLGVMTQAVSRLELGDDLYARIVDRDTYTERIGYPAGLVVAFAMARLYGFDWRYASLMGLVAVAACLAGGAARVWQRRKRLYSGEEWVPLVLALSVAWLALPTTVPFINWGHTMPVWGVIALMAACLAARWSILAALFAGILATMNAAWLLMLPVVAAYLWRESRASFAWALTALLSFPLLAYGYGRAHWFPMWEGIFGNLFHEGEGLAVSDSWRFATLHAFGDFLNLRYPVYTMAVVSVLAIARQIARTDDRRRRVEWMALAAFVLVAAGPVAFQFHWMAHAVLLAALLPVSNETEPATAAGTTRADGGVSMPVYTGGAVAALFAVLMLVRLFSGFDASINRQSARSQVADAFNLHGFWIGDPTHVWGSSTHMAIGVPMDRIEGGALELHLGTLGGDFTPYNPVSIRVNGRPKGVFRTLPGNFRYVTVPIDPGDLHRGVNVIELEAAWTRSPTSLGVAPDSRQMSVSYRGVRLLEMINAK